MSCTNCGSYNYIDHWYPASEDDPDDCGTGDGRTYTAVYEAYDPSGNSTMVTATITVPHDKR